MGEIVRKSSFVIRPVLLMKEASAGIMKGFFAALSITPRWMDEQKKTEEPDNTLHLSFTCKLIYIHSNRYNIIPTGAVVKAVRISEIEPADV